MHLKSMGLISSKCTTSPNWAPFNGIYSNLLVFPFDSATDIEEIYFTFDDQDVGQIAEIELTNWYCFFDTASTSKKYRNISEIMFIFGLLSQLAISPSKDDLIHQSISSLIPRPNKKPPIFAKCRPCRAATVTRQARRKSSRKQVTCPIWGVDCH